MSPATASDSTTPRGRGRRSGPPAPDGRQTHLDWLGLVDVTGPFLTLPVLLQTWPQPDALDPSARAELRAAHSAWQADPVAGHEAWIAFVLRDFLGWAGQLRTSADELAPLAVEIREHGLMLTPSFALVDDGEKPADGARMLGLVFPPNTLPHGRVRATATGDEDRSGATHNAVAAADGVMNAAWSASPVDRLATLLRAQGVELGLATDGRWWTLVWAPRGGVTSAAVFDAITWAESSDRVVVRAFFSLLRRKRFFGVDESETLLALLEESTKNQEDVTEALGVQVRKAVELLVDAIGRAQEVMRAERGADLSEVKAYDIYRGAVAVMMRVVFLLFAEERALLPADNDVYAEMYAASRLFEQLEIRLAEPDVTEDELEYSTAAWHRLLALFRAVHDGVKHEDLTLPAYDGSLFDPDSFPWLEGRLTPEDNENPGVSPLAIDDRTVYHMLKSVQYVEVGTGKKKERRRLSFRALNVEQIGYVYEGLLSFQGQRAADAVVGLIGKEGLEEEVELSTLEQLAAPFMSGGALNDVAGFAAVLAEKYKDSKLGTATALAKKLAPMSAGDAVEADRKLQAATGDAELARKLLPFAGILREDLRELPVVIKPGGLYVTESALRKNTGTHYTPAFLAEQVAEGALEPLVYAPGPLQTADKSTWKLRPAEEILALKVADIAMGSAAFLVAACRYLGDRLVEAWAKAGDERAHKATDDDGSARMLDSESEPVRVEARRQIIEHCLYGVDINPMAVEMAKLSLWLVSMDPHRPFTFLDDRLVSGDSLLGITSIEQLEAMDLNPMRGRKYMASEDVTVDALAGVRGLVRELGKERAHIGEVEGTDLAAMEQKRAILAEVKRHTQSAELLADLVVGAALATAGKSEREQRSDRLTSVLLARRFGRADDEGTKDTAQAQAEKWLATDLPSGGFERDPLHWPLAFPEVFERGGFDAVIGNPPFLGGQKLTGSLGTSYREYLVESLAGGTRGSADLVAYMVLRAHGLLNGTGQTGLIATNTLAQGDTREVALDQIVNAGTEIRMAVKSAPWPSKGAVLEYCGVWLSRANLTDEAPRSSDGSTVARIVATLDPASRLSWTPKRLIENANMGFQGTTILGTGFTMSPDVASAMIERDARNRDVLFRYINGEDLNSCPGGSGSRWVINFRDWSQAKSSSYHEPFDQVIRLVKPERAKVNEKRTRENWWLYTRPRAELYAAIAGLERVVAITRVSKLVMPAFVSADQILSLDLGVFATSDTAFLAFLSSAFHYWWAIDRSSTMRNDLRYSLTDAFETLPRPKLTQELREFGGRLDSYRRDLMVNKRNLGLTKTYNLVHDPAATGPDFADIEELRSIHRAIDYAVARAYGWDDLADGTSLEHGFHDTRQGTRYTISASCQREVLDRLLELNRDRYLAEHPDQGAVEQETLFDV